MASIDAIILKTHDNEIEPLCRYISSDQAIAAYFGIETQRVARVRAGMRRPSGVRGESQGYITEPGILLAEADQRRATTQASDALNDACWALYGKLADRHGLEHPLIAAVQFCGMRAA